MPAIIIIGLGFGDESKGSIVDYYCHTRPVDTVVRFNGGGQAAHNVVLPDGRHHTFSQFGSGTFVPDVKTFLSRFMLVDPLSMIAEERHLGELGIHDAFDRLTIDPDCIIVTPFQKAANRLREVLRGANRHGSRGMGIGETMTDNLSDDSLCLRARDLRDRKTVIYKSRRIRDLKRKQIDIGKVPINDVTKRDISIIADDIIPELADTFVEFANRTLWVSTAGYLDSILHDADVSGKTVIFEGAQGVLLDEWRGFHPYTTYSTTTFDNANALLNGYNGHVLRVGVTRAYMTRHGPGPFVTYSPNLSASLPDNHNHNNAWQSDFRVGWFDLVALRYSLQVVGGIDELAVSCIDRLGDEVGVCNAYHVLREIPVIDQRSLEFQENITRALLLAKPKYERINRDELMDYIGEQLQVGIGVTSYGPTWQDKRYTSGELNRRDNEDRGDSKHAACTNA